MKIMSKFISILLVLLMLCSAFVSCAKKDNDGEEDSAKVSETNVGATSGDTETAVPDIEVKNWGGKEYRVLGKYNSTYDWANSFEVLRDEMPEDTVGKAVWTRNKDIEDNYGIIVKGTLVENYNAAASTALSAGEDLYDLILNSPEEFYNYAIKGYLLDLKKLDYINLQHDAWIDFIDEQLVAYGKLYYTANKFLLQDKGRAYMLLYNRDLAKELNLGRFEELVFNNEWTVDKLHEAAKKATFEKDGNSGLSKGDSWGVAVNSSYHFAVIAIGAGFRFIDKDAGGDAHFIGATDDMMKKLDKVYELSTDVSAYWCEEQRGAINWDDCADHMFFREEALFSVGVVADLDALKVNGDFDFGVLPTPKYDSRQENYHATPNLGNGSLLGVPSTVSDREFAGYALELISEKSADSTYEAFVETKCKLQNVEDADAAKCLDIVFNGMVYDLGFINDIGGLGSQLTGTMGGSATNIYPRIVSRFGYTVETEIQKLKEAYAKIEY